MSSFRERPVVSSLPPSRDIPPLQRTQGYLFKKGGAVNAGGGRRNWKKRWFVLDYRLLRNRPFFELKYFEAPRGKQKGVIALQGTEVFCERRSSHKNVKFEFQILLQNGSTLQLSSETFKERDEWMESLNMAICYMKNPPEEAPQADEAVIIDNYDPSREYDDENNYAQGAAIAANCQAFGSGLCGAEAGTPAEFVVQVYDSEGQPVRVGGLPFAAYLEDDECLYHLRITDNDDGTYSAFYAVSRTSNYLLYIRLNDEHEIYGSPFEVTVVPSRTSPSHCTVTGDALTRVSPNNSYVLQLTARDAYGNKKQRGGELFEVNVSDAAQVAKITDHDDGTYTIHLTTLASTTNATLRAANLDLSITLRGKHVQGSPFRPLIIDAPLSSSRTAQPKTKPAVTASSPPVIQPADGVSKLALARQRALEAKEKEQQTPTLSRDDSSDSRSLQSQPPPQQYKQHTSPHALSMDDLLPPPAPESDFYSPTPFAEQSNSVKNRLSKLDMLAKKVGSSSKLGDRSAGKTSSASTSGAGVGDLYLVDVLGRGLPPVPIGCNDQETHLWTTTSNALKTKEISGLLGQHAALLQASYAIAAETSREGQQYLQLASSKTGGLYRLLEDFDVLPAYCTRKDVKILYQLIATSQPQLHDGSALGLDFLTYVRLLVMLVMYSLAKTPAFSSLYGTPKSKVEVMLFNWGFADATKIKHVVALVGKR